MRKQKQKLRRLQKIARLPKYHIPGVFIAAVSIIVLIIASVQAFTPGRACVDAPSSAYPSLEVVLQKGSARAQKTVTNHHLISCLADDLRHLPEYPSTPMICPQSDGSTFILSFDGGRIVTGSLSGCQSVKIQGDTQTYYLLPDNPYAKDFRTKLQRIVQDK